ncbi:DUF5677 domain-containing protein [Granulicella arctica]|uniref:Uncharacterized protein n=1 Tax=Granulicella arctica TaxID=940613 RepID=A0A7Y9PF97_9BACT|nr:DUF5677 domain-containing protein [Granulicella arctica]NYF78841.1 hypothetical protein [Granulicella arctica]
MNHGELLEHLQQLGGAINFSVVVPGETVDRAFDMATAAALVKAYEFCKEAAEADKRHSFFLLASLRGICEDYIALKFIHDKEETAKDEIIYLRMLDETHESSIVQWKFFKETHSSQRLYYRDNFNEERERIRGDLRKLLKNHRIKKNASMPSVHYMADEVGMLSLYQYVYHATSQFVHFNPRLLLRMGWGGPPRFAFTSANFGDYYQHFSVFYGSFLLIAIFEWLATIDAPAIRHKTPASLLLLKDYLQETSRWPELVTFEEMNIGVLSRHLLFKAPDEVHP